MGDLDQRISDHATAVLLRYYRAGLQVGPGNPRVEVERDRDILKAHWALSAPVRRLLAYLLSHPHEASALLTTERRVEDALARGRIDMRATLLHRRRSGSPTDMVTDVAVRNYENGPNHLLAWVVHHAGTWSSRFQHHKAAAAGDHASSDLDASRTSYAGMAGAVLLDVDRIRRLGSLRGLLLSPSVSRRPGPAALRDASRSRRPVYRLAVTAHDLLRGIEEGSQEAIRTVVNSTLVGPLENWRRLELAVATTIGEALAAETGEPLVLDPIASGARPVLTCGRYALHWQRDGGLYEEFEPTEPETRTKGILQAYGLTTGSDRPDLVLVDQGASRVTAVVEVKYLAGDTATARFREAVAQVVHYTRAYAAAPDLERLVGRSLVVMSKDAPHLRHPGPGVPTALDFEDLVQGRLHPWVRSLLDPA